MKIVDFFPVLCRMRPEVSGFHFETFHPGPGLSDRLRQLLTDERAERELLAAADRSLIDSSIPFWEALAGVAMKRDGLAERFIRAALFHVPKPSTIPFSLDTRDLLEGGISRIIDQVPAGDALAICSRVRLASGELMHLPMMDFICPCSKGNSDAIVKMLEIVGQREGVLVESGRSYHFYGMSLLSLEAWIDFMAKALLFAPFTDPRYIGHRLADGQCRLRIYSQRPTPVITRILG